MRTDSCWSCRRHYDAGNAEVFISQAELGTVTDLTTRGNTTVTELPPSKSCHATGSAILGYQSRRDTVQVASLAWHRVRDRHMGFRQVSSGLGCHTIKSTCSHINTMARLAATGNPRVIKSRVSKGSAVDYR